MEKIKQLEVLKAAEELVYLQQGNEYSGHDYYHVKRVVNMALDIAHKMEEPIDTFLLELVCWLHDVDDPKIVYSGEHTSVKSFLKLHEVDDNMASIVIDIISKLSYSASKKGLKETTIEGMIAQDADRLDAIGAVGIARTFAYGGANKRAMVSKGIEQSTRYHFDDKLFKLEQLMNTKEGKRIAKIRTAYMREFINQFDQETKI